MKHRAVVWGLVSVLAAVGLFTYWKSAARARAEGAALRERELAALRAEVEGLKQSSAAELRRAMRAGSEARPIRPGPVAQVAPAEEARDPALEGDGAEAPPITEEEIAVQLDNGFDAEPRDPAWSDEATREATRALSDGLPAGSSLTRVECRTHLCRVESRHDDIEAFRAFADASFLSRERKIWNGGFSTMVRSESESGVVAVSYIAKEGESVPGPEPVAANH